MPCPPDCPGTGGDPSQGLPSGHVTGGDPTGALQQLLDQNLNIPTGSGFMGPTVPAGWKAGGSGFNLTPHIVTTDDTPDGPDWGDDPIDIETQLWLTDHYNPGSPNTPVKQDLGKLAKNRPGPCANSSQLIKNAQIPPRTGDVNSDSGPGWSTDPSQTQANGLKAERVLADIADDYADWSSDGSDLQTTIENVVNGLPHTATGLEVAEDIVAALLQNALGVSPDQLSGLSPALVQTLDQIAQEIQNGNGGNIDWSSFGDYIAAQADADADQMQIGNLGGGKLPCGDVQDAVNNAADSQRNNQQKANNALKKLDKNIKPPKLPPGGQFNPRNQKLVKSVPSSDATDYANPAIANLYNTEVDALNKVNAVLNFLKGFTGKSGATDTYTNLVNAFNALLALLGWIAGIKFPGEKHDSANDITVDPDPTELLRLIGNVSGYLDDMNQLLKELDNGTLDPPVGWTVQQFYQKIESIIQRLEWLLGQLNSKLNELDWHGQMLLPQLPPILLA